MQAAERAVEAFLLACRLDVETAKPGNVSVMNPGHGMTAAQFVASAQAAAPALFAHQQPVGARIFDAVTRTRAAAGCNTNLGIVLLVAPLAAALDELGPVFDVASWRTATANVLAHLTVEDTRMAYRAIALANPGGLGDAPQQSVHDAPSVDLREAMTLAAERDSIARQYANGFDDIFTAGLDALHVLRERCENVITLSVFMTFLSTWPDSHIVRKHGAATAQSVTREARILDEQWRLAGARADHPGLDAWDAELKSSAINPGTSADLTVATLFVAACLERLRPRDWHGTC
jgi:triphosphoribosyl-dephospho-CoA synthase